MQRFHWRLLGVMASLAAVSPLAHAQLTTDSLGSGVAVLATDPTALSGTSSGAFTVLRRGPATNDLTLDLTVSGTASNGVDYATIPDTVTIPSGSLAVDIPVNPIFNADRRGNKTVVLSLGTNVVANVRCAQRATVLIVDDVFNIPPPMVAITSPTNGSVFADPPSVEIDADASSMDSAIASVSFYANDKFLGRSTNSPYSLMWSNPPAGKFTLFARAVNDVGESALSAPVRISIQHVLPTVTITDPTNGQNFTAHSDITVSADASDADDTIQSVTFFANDHRLGTVTEAPYSLVWSNAPMGIFALRAMAVDADGDRGFSKPVVINVSRLPIGRLSLLGK